MHQRERERERENNSNPQILKTYHHFQTSARKFMFLDKEHKVSSKKEKVCKEHAIDTSTEKWMSVIVKDKEYIYITFFEI